MQPGLISRVTNLTNPHLLGTMDNITREEFYQLSPQHKTADITIGVLYILCFICGVPSNILSFYFFTRRRFKNMDIPTFLYTLTALNDALTSVLVLVNGVTMLRGRDVWLPSFCATQHILFQMTQRMSVFLVAILSSTRTYSLVSPLRRVRIRSIQIASGVFWALMSCFFVLPPLLQIVQITYHFEGGYCWAEPIPNKNFSKTWDKFDNAMDTVGLAFPVVPITVSCIISTHKILISKRVKTRLMARKLSSNTQKKCSLSSKSSYRRATCTIILVTILYIVSNLPLFVNYVLYLITILSFNWPGPIYDSTIMYFYSWNLTAILSTGLNASVNPVIYLTRFKRYRIWVLGGCRRGLSLDRTNSQVIKQTGSKTPSNGGKVKRFAELRFAKKLENKLLNNDPEYFSDLNSGQRGPFSSGELVTTVESWLISIEKCVLRIVSMCGTHGFKDFTCEF